MLDMNSFDSLAVIVAANAMVVVFFAARALRHIGHEKKHRVEGTRLTGELMRFHLNTG